MISSRAIWTIRSLTVGIPSALRLPSDFGIYTLLRFLQNYYVHNFKKHKKFLFFVKK
jgi:hypothetical protein